MSSSAPEGEQPERGQRAAEFGMGVTVVQDVALKDQAGRWSLRAELAALHDSFVTALAGGYHPELHYMRGPGPKWREKYASVVPQTGATPLFPESIPA